MRKGLLSILTVNETSAEHYYEILLPAYAFLLLYLGFCSFNAANKEFQTLNLLLSCFYPALYKWLKLCCWHWDHQLNAVYMFLNCTIYLFVV